MKLKHTNGAGHLILAVVMLLCLQIGSFADSNWSMDQLISDPDYHMSWTNDGFTTITNAFFYNAPVWTNGFTELNIDNISVTNNHKTFALILHYDTIGDIGSLDVGITNVGNSGVTNVINGVQKDFTVAYTWRIEPQPASETLTFSKNMSTLDHFTKMEFATKCIPEPGTLGLMGFAGGIALIFRRKRFFR